VGHARGSNPEPIVARSISILAARADGLALDLVENLLFHGWSINREDSSGVEVQKRKPVNVPFEQKRYLLPGAGR